MIPQVTLRPGVSMPQLGYGVFQIAAEETAPCVEAALEAGYRSIDTAAIYGNEAEVGKAVQAVQGRGIDRGELFITTKLWNADQGYDATLAAFDASLAALGTDYVDLYLIHWPVPAHDRYVATWRAMERLHADGRVRAIGVSNFHISHLQRLMDETQVVPAVNQIELHPNLAQRGLREFHAEHGIVTEAWSPLAQGGLLGDPVVTDLAQQHGKTPAQVVLRWHIQLGNVVIPKSVTRQRIVENIDVFDFALSAEELARIDALDSGARIGPDPDTFNRL
ncbi:aldo/keto reductase [Haloechinothrix sp. LS1_15]|uniref:aldo/keto reductase n=1 Tax=Haloechinothrix sp. LS1_15 TaxID=2652248 RepID=UPI0029452302|nr:aldo/keto reductase [Haloechinothrix sp. LS1_15]MDV6014627.1 aldo/keto reductase [Haloechinothrix sp. LS1_15]